MVKVNWNGMPEHDDQGVELPMGVAGEESSEVNALVEGSLVLYTKWLIDEGYLSRHIFVGGPRQLPEDEITEMILDGFMRWVEENTDTFDPVMVQIVMEQGDKLGFALPEELAEGYLGSLEHEELMSRLDLEQAQFAATEQRLKDEAEDPRR